jgi:hypothetical protein
MIRIALLLLLQLLLLAGIGRFFQQWWWKQRVLGLAETTWLGLAVVIVLAQVWHFFLPINGVLGVLLILLALPGVVELWKEKMEQPRGVLIWWATLVAGFALLISCQAAVRSVGDGDTLLYHLNVVRWFNEYAVVPGLANLHQRFGVNSTWLLYGSLWDCGWCDGRSAWIIPGLPVLLTLAQWLWVLMVSPVRQSAPSKAYCLLTLPYLLECVEWVSPSLYYDKAPLLLLLTIGLHALHTPWMRSGLVSTDWTHSALWMLTAAALSFSFKASTAMALVFITMAIVAHWAATSRRLGELIRITALPTLLLLGYMVTNVIVSGYPLFPSAALGMPVSWAQPKDEVAAFYRIIADWAPLRSSEGMKLVREGFWSWWPLWVHDFSKTVEYLLALLSLGLSFWCGYQLTSWGKPSRFPWRRRWVAWMLLLCLACVLFWLGTSPDLRFGDGFFFLWIGLAGAVVTPFIRSRVAVVAALLLAIFVSDRLRPSLLPRRPIYATKVWQARPDDVIQQAIPGGPTIWVPKDKQRGMLGDSPLPSAPTADTRLREREPGNPGAGYFLQR